MGNRLYITLKNSKERKTFYLHWNGGLDTQCPFFQYVFKNDVQDIQKIERLYSKLEIKIELETSPDSRHWTEENGHLFVDLVDHSIILKKENGESRLLSSDLKIEFEKYLSERIREEHRGKVRVEYWEGILQALE